MLMSASFTFDYLGYVHENRNGARQAAKPAKRLAAKHDDLRTNRLPATRNDSH
jgi:hypothetical protein